MKRYYVETNAEAMVVFVDENGKAFPFRDGEVDTNNQRLTLETAKAADYSGIEDCETIEEIINALSSEFEKDVFDFSPDDFEVVEEF